MKIFKFFITKIFLRKAILTLGMILLLLFANFLTFTFARSLLATFQGYQQMKGVNQKDTYICNLDPDSDIVSGTSETQPIYDYLNENFKYACYTDGLMVSVPNSNDMEISLAYMNKEYYDLNQYELSQGTDLDFDYQLDKDTEIPVLIGKGLSKDYPVGSTIKIDDPSLEQKITLKVQGVLKENAYHSNFYSPNMKTYYNFTIFIPVNEDFINNASTGFQFNELMDLVVLKTTKEKTVDLCKVMQDNLGLKFNFYSQEENFEDFNEYFMYSLKGMGTTTLILLIVLTCLSIWSSLVGIRLMMKDFTINLLVGLSYSKLKRIFYSYFGILFFVNLFFVFAYTAYNRYGSWLRKDATYVTYGLFGVIGIDWIALLIVLVSDLIIGKIIVEIMLWKIKKIPISLGVLQ